MQSTDLVSFQLSAELRTYKIQTDIKIKSFKFIYRTIVPFSD